MELVVGNGLLLVFVIIEIIILRFFRNETLPWKEILSNFNSGHILLWIFRGLEIAAYYYTVLYFSFGLLDEFPYWAKWVIAFILWDFCFYWLHRTHHYFKVLWGVHSVHHEGEHFSLSLGIRNSWYSSLTSFPYFIGLALLGIPVEIFVAVSSIHYFIQFYNHNHLVKKSGFLEYILVTPSHHRVHHGKNQPYFNKNFSGTFVIWDKLFGTFQAEQEDIPVLFGLDEAQHTHNPIVVNNAPFIKLYGKKKIQLPQLKSTPIEVPDAILLSGGLLLFAQLLFYIYFETQFTDHRTILLFSMIFLGTIGNGLLSDGNRWGITVWSLSTILFPLALFYFFKGAPFYFEILLLISVAQGFVSLVWIKKVNENVERSYRIT